MLPWCAETSTVNHLVDAGNHEKIGYYDSSRWDYWYKFEGRKIDAIVVSNDDYTRGQALEIASMIINQRGIKRWSIDLS